jgi:hypothetical protein
MLSISKIRLLLLNVSIVKIRLILLTVCTALRKKSRGGAAKDRLLRFYVTLYQDDPQGNHMRLKLTKGNEINWET